MRDIIITLIIFSSLPFILKRPHVGVLMWIWISVMNPHRLAYGFAYEFPFALIIALVTVVAMLGNKIDKRLPFTPIVVALLMFWAWMPVTTLFALYPELSMNMLITVSKIMAMTVVTIMLIKTRAQIYQMIWVLVLSLAYYGVKGGIFTVLKGGHSIVWGPDGSFISGNNELALALITVIPMMYCLYLNTTRRWLRVALVAMMVLCSLSALGSYSRGALIGIGAMVLLLWMKSPKKMAVGVLLLMIIPPAIIFMPAQWGDRMETIDSYQKDASAMGRINAWHMAFNLASARPLVGGGYAIWTSNVFKVYAPDPNDTHAAHSIYFQALGEHGFVGLLLYLSLAWLTWRKGSTIIRQCGKREDLRWAVNVATTIQVSMVGFATGGAFLSLLYFDVPYYLIAAMVATGTLVEQAIKAGPPLATAGKARNATLAGAGRAPTL